MVVAVANQKGGVGKTTVTFQLGIGLVRKGYKVLFIDMDSQGNLSYMANAEPLGPTVFDAIVGEIPVNKAIRHHNGYDILVSSPDVSVLEKRLPKNHTLYALKYVILKIQENYDYILIDSAPMLGVNTVNVLTAADKVLIPALADTFSLAGIGQLYSTIKSVVDYTNPALQVDGIVLSRYSGRFLHAKAMNEMMSEVAKSINSHLYEHTIREGIAVREATTCRQSIFEYAPKSKQAQDFDGLVEEFLERNPIENKE